MKAFVTLLGILVFSCSFSFSQTDEELKSKLDELQKEKQQITSKISELKTKQDQVDKQIYEIEVKLNAGKNAGGTSGILTKTGSNGAILRATASSTGTQIIEIPADDDILVHKKNVGLYFEATYKGKKGFVSYSSIVTTPEIDKILIESNNQGKTIDKQKQARLTKVYGKETADKIMAGILWEGMSQGMVIESIGRPVNTAKSASDQGVREVWTYDDKEVIFLNGTLHKWAKK